jgi:SpoVK/Ycf46/Vps4 family AAA+-type ATPase
MKAEKEKIYNNILTEERGILFTHETPEDIYYKAAMKAMQSYSDHFEQENQELRDRISELEKAAKDLIGSYNTRGLINIEDRINELEQILAKVK